MKFRTRIPNFVDAPQPPDFTFDNIAELLLFARVKLSIEGDRFHQLSLSKNLLMVEYDKGAEWWVLGTIFGTEPELESLKLPIWKAPQKIKLEQHAAGNGEFDIVQNQKSRLWEIFDRKKGRKIGGCMHKPDVERLIKGYLESEIKAGY